MESQKHGKERRRIWRKLHLAVDSNTHEIICADPLLNNVTNCGVRKSARLSHPEKVRVTGPVNYADRNRAVANQRMTGSNAR